MGKHGQEKGGTQRKSEKARPMDGRRGTKSTEGHREQSTVRETAGHGGGREGGRQRRGPRAGVGRILKKSKKLDLASLRCRQS